MIPDSESNAATGFARRANAIYRHTGVRYLIAGGLSFIVDFGLLTLFKEVLAWPLWLSTATAFLLSFVFNYLVQRVFSFSSNAPHGVALVKYTLLVAFNTLATVVIVGLVNQADGSWGIGKVLSTAATTVWNYFIYKYWVFRSAKGQRDPLPPVV
jgi:putative flippase GtrA